MSLLQNSSLFFLVTFIAMVVAVPHGKFNASRTNLGYETSTSTSHPWTTISSLISQADDATERTTLNSSYFSSSNTRLSSTIFKLSNTSTPTLKAAMIGDNNEKNAEAQEENGNVKIIGDGFVEVNITELSIGVCLRDCYNDLQICYEAVDPSSDLPQRICGYSGQCGLRIGTLRKNHSRIWFMEEGKYTASRYDIGECQYTTIHPGLIEFVYHGHSFGADDVGCTPNIIPGKYMKITVEGASKVCPVLIATAKLKPEPTTVVPGASPNGQTTPESSSSELSIWLAVGGLILFIIIVVAIIGFVCWKKRQNKAKQQLPPAKPMKAIMDKPIEDSEPLETATAIPVEAKPAVKEEKALVPIHRDVDIEKAESAVKEEKISVPVDRNAKKAEPAPMKPQAMVEAKKTEAVEPVEEAKLVKEAREIVKRRTHIVNETQKDEPRPRRAPSKKKTTKVAAPSPSDTKEEEEPSKEASTLSPLPHIDIKLDHQKNDRTEKSDAYHLSDFSSKKYNPILEEGSDE